MNEKLGNLPANNSLVLDTRAIITSIITALVVGGIVGALAFSRLTESNTYRLDTAAQAIEKLQKESINREVYELNQQAIERRLANIEKLLTDLDKKIDEI